MNTASAEPTLRLGDFDLLVATGEQYAEAARLADLRDELAHVQRQIDASESRFRDAIGIAGGIRGICTFRVDAVGHPRWKPIAHALGAIDIENASLVRKLTSLPRRRFLFTYQESPR